MQWVSDLLELKSQTAVWSFEDVNPMFVCVSVCTYVRTWVYPCITGTTKTVSSIFSHKGTLWPSGDMAANMHYSFLIAASHYLVSGKAFGSFRDNSYDDRTPGMGRVSRAPQGLVSSFQGVTRFHRESCGFQPNGSFCLWFPEKYMEFDLNNEGEIGEWDSGGRGGGWVEGLRSKEPYWSGEGHWMRLKNSPIFP